MRTLSLKAIFGPIAVLLAIYVFTMPDSRTPENFRKEFRDRGMELITFDSVTFGCSHAGAYSYRARLKSGEIEEGVICANKPMTNFRILPRRKIQ